MLPKLRIILVAMLATCAVVLALSAGVVGARGPSDIAAVPEVSRTLHAFAEPDQQQLHLLAYSRRADELLRLRDLPVTPVRAVVEYAEQAQARAAETKSAAVPAATSPAAAVTPPASVFAPSVDSAAPTPTVETAAADTRASATPPTEAPSPTVVAVAPVASPHVDTTAASPPVQSASPATVVTPAADTAPTPTESAAAPSAAPAETVESDTKVAAVAPGSSATDEMYGPEKPRADGKPRHRTKTARPHPPKPKKKPQVTIGTAQPAAAPAASTGYPVAQPNTRSNAFGGWRNDGTAR
jgi:hypothetical protein